MFEKRAQSKQLALTALGRLAPWAALAFVSAAVSRLLFADLTDSRAAATAVPAVVVLLAPLFAPLGRASRDAAVRLVAWCVLCAAAALLTLVLICPVPAPGAVLAASFGMCLALLLASHAVLLLLCLAPGEGPSEQRRELAAWAVSGSLAVLGAAPLWLAPLAQAFNGSAAVANLAVAVSPLSYLAAATGSDVLRTDWFYRHSGISSMRYAYPAIGTVLVGCAAICLAGLAVVLAAPPRQARRVPQ